jgi:hypothetical protein
MRVPRICIAVACAGMLVSPAAAPAQGTIAPPGKSGADQYFETIPSARGNVAPPGSAGGGTGSASAGVKRIAHLGKDGQAASALAAATAPSSGSGGSGPGGQTGNHALGGAASTALGHVINGSDSGGLGLWLPILLGSSLLIAVAIVATRLLRRPETG